MRKRREVGTLQKTRALNMKKQDKLPIQTLCGAFAVEFKRATYEPMVLWRKRRHGEKLTGSQSLLEKRKGSNPALTCRNEFF